MKLKQYLIESIKLQPFDNDVFNSIEGKEHMYLKKDKGTYYTIVDGDKKIGIVGFTNTESEPFLQIGIIKEFRGKGYFEKAYNMLFSKHGFKIVYADIEKTNKKSIEAHEEMGFQKMDNPKDVDRRFYNEYDIRMKYESN